MLSHQTEPKGKSTAEGDESPGAGRNWVQALRHELPWRLYGLAAGALINQIGRSCRWRILDFQHYLRLLNSGKPFIFSLWHGRQFLLVYAFRNSNIRILVSKSRDGELIHRPLLRCGLATIRGSTTRGGAEAYQQLGLELLRGHQIAITPDGPLGPDRTVAPGIIAIAKRYQAPILPLTTAAQSAWRASSWDHFLAPHPYTSVVIAFGKPIIAPVTDDPLVFSATQDRLRGEMNRITDQADAVVQGGNSNAEVTTIPGRGLPPLAFWRCHRLFSAEPPGELEGSPESRKQYRRSLDGNPRKSND